MTDQREDFEEAANRLGFPLNMRDVKSEDGEYLYQLTQCVWEMWQECCALKAEPVACRVDFETWAAFDCMIHEFEQDSNGLYLNENVQSMWVGYEAGCQRQYANDTQPQSAELDAGIPVSEIEQKAEPVAWLWVKNGLRSPVPKDFADELIKDGESVQPLCLCTQPQNAVPESWRSAARVALDFAESGLSECCPLPAEAHIKGLARLILSQPQSAVVPETMIIDDEPDLAWDSEAESYSYGAEGLENISIRAADNMEPNSEKVIKILCAKKQPDRFLRVALKDDGIDQTLEWAWVSQPKEQES